MRILTRCTDPASVYSSPPFQSTHQTLHSLMQAVIQPAARSYVGGRINWTVSRPFVPRADTRYKQPQQRCLPRILAPLPKRWRGEPINHFNGRCQTRTQRIAKRIAAVPKGIRCTRAAQIAGNVKFNMIRGGATLQQATRKAVFMKAYTVEKALGVTKHVAKEKAHRVVKTIFPPQEKFTNCVMEFLKRQRKAGNVSRASRLLPTAEKLEEKLRIPMGKRVLFKDLEQVPTSLRELDTNAVSNYLLQTPAAPQIDSVTVSTHTAPVNSTSTNPIIIPNPFIPHFDRATNRWVRPQYSLRQQAQLVKAAKATGQLHLLPSGPKADIVTLQRPRLAPMVPIVESAGKRPLQFIGEWMNTAVKGSTEGNKLYASKRRLFKGRKVERQMYQKVRQRTLLMSSMENRIQRWKTVSFSLSLRIR